MSFFDLVDNLVATSRVKGARIITIITTEFRTRLRPRPALAAGLDGGRDGEAETEALPPSALGMAQARGEVRGLVLAPSSPFKPGGMLNEKGLLNLCIELTSTSIA
eukprot:3134117-Amphidinium_carterae.2